MNIIIEEEVLVPDVPIIEEQVLYPSNPISVEEEVLVPAIVQEVQRQYKLDPLWDSLEETPKNHIQMIVYKGRDEDYDVSFWFYDQNIRVDWGDGIIEDFVNSKGGLDRVNHKFVDGSGKLDSNGERFWFVDITIIKDNIAYNTFNLSNYNNNSDYIKPNMPFSITIEPNIIDTTISDDVLISNIKECGEIIVKGTNGLVEFNKTADSTTSILYFLNIRKDKSFQVLQFDTTSNQLTSTIIQ